MKSRLLSGIAIVFLLFGIAGESQAALSTIGAAQYNGTFYGMIYDDDLQLVWLDYANPRDTWQNQMSWAEGLNVSGTLEYAWFPEYADFSWTGDWRLPSAGADPYWGYNQITSEMGHLYYTELNNSELGPLTNTGEFKNLTAFWYWSGTEYARFPTWDAWMFYMGDGDQNTYLKGFSCYGLAVRSGQVSAVPVPGAIWLLGSGLAGLAVLSRRKIRNRV